VRILIPTVDYPPIEGGISSLAVHVARALVAQGHEVTVVAPRLAGWEEFDGGEGCRVVRFGGYGLGPLRFFPLLWGVLGELGRCDAILAINVAYGGPIGLFARVFFGKRYVAFAYGYEFMKFHAKPVPNRIFVGVLVRFFRVLTLRDLPLVRVLYRLIYRCAVKTVAISVFTRNELIRFGLPRGYVRVLHPGASLARGVDGGVVAGLRAGYGVEAGKLVFSVGRFVPRKGHLLLIRAFARLLESEPHTRLVIAGRGPMWEACARRVEVLGLEGLVFLPGHLDDDSLAAHYAACDVFVLAASEVGGGHVEGFGIVLAEAAAYGKPCVAARTGGVEDAVLDGRTGILTAADDEFGLVDALERLVGDGGLAARMGDAGRARVEGELNWGYFAGEVVGMLEGRG